ncbi:uncharacterized protein LOC115880370 [Sitophilus oryzae]|uniref:Uncharacterized protein LOC115880370 n=1 Tax=Sitophilus oryzae TaxID=7048 RepID=A0A6J2XPK6_SITOR|nr:uncharacterized protein LOC115880370 [Sitophilus oryzae]
MHKFVLLSIVLQFYVVYEVSGLRCFQCHMVQHPYYITDNKSVLTCKDFDYSNKFIVECPHSTFCYKRTSKNHFYKEDFVRVERGCASQLYRGQNFDPSAGFYQEEYVVGNAYKRGCRKVESFGERRTDIEDCYCDSDLCNASDRLRNSAILCVILPILLILLRS